MKNAYISEKITLIGDLIQITDTASQKWIHLNELCQHCKPFRNTTFDVFEYLFYFLSHFLKTIFLEIPDFFSCIENTEIIVFFNFLPTKSIN